MDPTPNSVVLTQRVILHSPSKFTPTLDSFSAASYLVTNGTLGPEPMVYIQMPQIHALHPVSNHSVENQKVDILSLEQLSAYASAILSSEYVETALIGKTPLHLGALPSTVINYNTVARYKGISPALIPFHSTPIPVLLTFKIAQLTHAKVSTPSKAST